MGEGDRNSRYVEVPIPATTMSIAHKSDSRLGDGSRIITAETEGEGERRLVVN